MIKDLIWSYFSIEIEKYFIRPLGEIQVSSSLYTNIHRYKYKLGQTKNQKQKKKYNDMIRNSQFCEDCLREGQPTFGPGSLLRVRSPVGTGAWIIIIDSLTRDGLQRTLRRCSDWREWNATVQRRHRPRSDSAVRRAPHEEAVRLWSDMNDSWHSCLIITVLRTGRRSLVGGDRNVVIRLQLFCSWGGHQSCQSLHVNCNNWCCIWCQRKGARKSCWNGNTYKTG